MKVIILLYGLPSTGKYTIAKELSKKLDMNLIDNHYFNNIIFPYVRLDKDTLPEICNSVYRIRNEFLNMVCKYKNDDKGMIFTNVLLDTDMDRKAVDDLIDFSNKLNYKFIPIELVCDDNNIKQRINSDDRKEKYKLTDFNVWKQFVNNNSFMHINHHYELNTSYNTLEETVGKILKIVELEMEKVS